MKVTDITVVIGGGPDTVLMKTDLPHAHYPWTGFLTVKFHAAAGTGAAYADKHFPGVPVEIVSMDTGAAPPAPTKPDPSASCVLRRQGKAYPKTCKVCGLGPCKYPDKKS